MHDFMEKRFRTVKAILNLYGVQVNLLNRRYLPEVTLAYV